MGIKKRIEQIEETLGLTKKPQYWITGRKEKDSMRWSISRVVNTNSEVFRAIRLDSKGEEHKNISQKIDRYLKNKYGVELEKWREVYCGAWSEEGFISAPFLAHGGLAIGFYN